MATRVIPSLSGSCEVIKPLAKHTATVIFLHGLGDSGKGWLPIARLIKDELPHVKWLFPNAPTRKITANSGFMMPAWFDIPSWDLEDKHEDRDGMLDSARTIDQHIQDEINLGIPAERIVVGGFSQGGCMSLLAGLTARGEDGLFEGKRGWKLGGVAVLSGWMPLQDTFPKVCPLLPAQTRDNTDELSQMASPHLTTTPILMCHGTEDVVVPYSLGQRVSRTLTNDLGVPALENLTLEMSIPPSYSPGRDKLGTAGLSFRSYRSVGHEACERIFEDLKEFLKHVLQ
ncbi:Alpha/Beta hydrolase protein [Lanmaoa asiatica]|nr:Alpha/Beta hydrolase protein [Lanmaoa asiatica]